MLSRGVQPATVSYEKHDRDHTLYHACPVTDVDENDAPDVHTCTRPSSALTHMHQDSSLSPQQLSVFLLYDDAEDENRSWITC